MSLVLLLSIAGKLLLLCLIVFGPLICALIQASNASRSREALGALQEHVRNTQSWKSADRYFERRVPLLRGAANPQARDAFVKSMAFMSFLLLVLMVPILFPEWVALIWSTPNFMLAGPLFSLHETAREKVTQYQLTTMAIASMAIIAAYVRLLFDIVVRFNTDQFGAMQIIFSATRLAAAPLVAILVRHVLYAVLSTDPPPQQPTSATLPPDSLILMVSVLVAVAAGVQPDIWLSSLLRFISRTLEGIPPTKWLVPASQSEPDQATLPEAKPLTLLVGMGVDHREKLMEVDITECQRLAAGNPLVTWVRTSLGLSDVIEFCDRANLAVAFDAAMLQKLRGQGVIGALQLKSMDAAGLTRLAELLEQPKDLFAARIAALLRSPAIMELEELAQAVRAGIHTGTTG